jgi:hypothetical protein
VRQRHRHVEVRRPRLERRVEDRHHEARVARVEHGVSLRGTEQFGNRGWIAGIELYAGEALVGGALSDRLGASLVVVGHHDRIEEPPPRRDLRRCSPDTTCPNDHCSHPLSVSVAPTDYEVTGAFLNGNTCNVT